MGREYRLKLILLLFFSIGIANYFMVRVASPASLQTFFILAWTVFLVYEELRKTKSELMQRKGYQKIIDRSLLFICLLSSVDIIYSLAAYGLA